MKQLAKITRDALTQTVEGIIGVGKMLIKAHDDLNGEWGAWSRLINGHDYESRLPFDGHTTYRLIAIAEDERMLAHAQALPPSWMTLYALTRLDRDEFDAAIGEGTVQFRHDPRPVGGPSPAPSVTRTAERRSGPKC